MNYNILVIDDEKESVYKFERYKTSIKSRYDIDVNFTVVNNIEEYQFSERYDILLVDYMLHGAFKDIELGTDFIREFRKKNKLCKIIFFSASFAMNEKLNLKFNKIAELINIYSIDKIVSKDDRNLMLESIKDCCEEINLFSLSLTRMVNEYKRANVKLWYETSNGDSITGEDLVHELLLKSPIAKEFQENLYKTFLNLTLKDEL